MGSTRLSAEGAVGRGLSPALWQAYGFIGGDFGDPSLKPFIFDDFEDLGVMANTVSQGGYKTYQDAGVTIQQCASTDNSEGEFGVLEISHDGTTQDEGSIELGSGVAGLVKITPTVIERAVVVAEARIKVPTVVVGDCCFAFGLAEPGQASADALVNTTGALDAAGKDFVGFQTLLTSNSEIDTVYAIGGTGATVQVKDNAGTMVADTWIKLGLVYDPNSPDDKSIKFFIDGVEQGDSVTDAIVTAAIAFPSGEELTLLFATKILTGTATTAYMDWWAVGSFPVDV